METFFTDDYLYLILCSIIWKHLAWEKANCSNIHSIQAGARLSKVIRVRYERGTLRPIDYVEFKEGEEFEVIIIKRTFRGFREKSNKYKFEVDRDIVKEFVAERR